MSGSTVLLCFKTSKSTYLKVLGRVLTCFGDFDGSINFFFGYLSNGQTIYFNVFNIFWASKFFNDSRKHKHAFVYHGCDGFDFY